MIQCSHPNVGHLPTPMYVCCKPDTCNEHICQDFIISFTNLLFVIHCCLLITIIIIVTYFECSCVELHDLTVCHCESFEVSVMCFKLRDTFVCELIESHRTELWDFLEFARGYAYIITVIVLAFIQSVFI